MEWLLNITYALALLLTALALALIVGIPTAYLVNWLLGRSQSLRPRYLENREHLVFEVGPSRGEFWSGLFVTTVCALCSLMFLVVPLLAWHDFAEDLSILEMAVSLAVGGLALYGTPVFFYSTARTLRAGIEVSPDGLRCWNLRKSKPILFEWDEIEKVEYKDEGDLRIIATGKKKFRLGRCWYGFPVMFLFMEAFIPEERWPDVKQGLGEYFQKRKGFEELRRAFADRLQDFQASEQPGLSNP